MLQIIAKIPLFVWPLFSALLIAGLRARKTNMVPLGVLLLIPSIFFGWSLFALLSREPLDPLAIFLWILCLAVGLFIGFFHIQRLRLEFDREKKRVKMPGSWIPLILSMSIFSSKFSVGMMRAMLPHLEGSVLFLSLELFSTIILGVFAGRGIGCLFRYCLPSLLKGDK